VPHDIRPVAAGDKSAQGSGVVILLPAGQRIE
jgi:hypothetical protein